MPPQPDRALRRLLRRLTAPGGRIAARGAAFALVNGEGADVPLAAEIVESLARRGWIARIPEGYRATPEAAAALRRMEAEEEPFLAQQGVAPPKRGGKSAAPTVDHGESCLAWLARRKGPDGKPMLSDAEIAAGKRLERDYALAQLEPRMTADWSRPFTGETQMPKSREDLAVSLLAARRRFNAALTAAGPGLADVLFAMCFERKGLEAIERQFAWPQRAGKIVLKIALQRLAAFYDGRLDQAGESFSKYECSPSSTSAPS